ncbi:tripartite tricarboxylate transporter substrate binding protein [Bordetella sp. LUAb4]|uniref:Bug family tripartite tricarboxylate transporter substrate binding protein n=1 Tax=Bordetella sp. LUAb4 TaxID=2843195 RepID=UPI001E2BF552|nr:tripartite tricarboxylate transporter substrate binding protein [Bordetella sp. LUAb4]
MVDTFSDCVIEYPQRSISLVIGGPPGGGTDMLARRVCERISVLLGQRVRIEYRLGASGNLAAMAVAQAKPDGYTILLGTRSATLHRKMYPHLAYDFGHDLTPIAMLARVPVGIVMGHHVLASNLRDVIRMARENPNRFSAATLGVGTTDHLVSVLLRNAARIQWQHVPYMEMSRALKDVVGGRVDLLFAQLAGGVSHLNAGSVRGLAVTSTSRVADFPDIPTIAEVGFPQASADDWFVALAPSATPSDVLAKLNDAFNQALEDQTLRWCLGRMGYLLPSSKNTAVSVKAHLADDNTRWTSVIQDNQISGFQ